MPDKITDKQIDRVSPPLPSLTFSPQAAEKLRLYVGLCPFEISGLGEVEIQPSGFLVTDLFLPRQRCYYTFTELLPDELARFLISYVGRGKDPARLTLWWHSHADMDVFWSPTDDYTARGFHNDYMLSLVTNKTGDSLCRLDLFQPLALTIDRLEVIMPPGPPAEDRATVDLIRKEIADQVMIYTE